MKVYEVISILERLNNDSEVCVGTAGNTLDKVIVMHGNRAMREVTALGISDGIGAAQRYIIKDMVILK